MDTTNTLIADKLREHFDTCSLSSNSVGYFLLLEVIICRMKNPCLSLNDVYTMLAEKHGCKFNSVKCSIQAAIQEANENREKKGEDPLVLRHFVNNCVNRFSDVNL